MNSYKIILFATTTGEPHWEVRSEFSSDKMAEEYTNKLCRTSKIIRAAEADVCLFNMTTGVHVATFNITTPVHVIRT